MRILRIKAFFVRYRKLWKRPVSINSHHPVDCGYLTKDSSTTNSVLLPGILFSLLLLRLLRILHTPSPMRVNISPSSSLGRRHCLSIRSESVRLSALLMTAETKLAGCPVYFTGTETTLRFTVQVISIWIFDECCLQGLSGSQLPLTWEWGTC